ncbi:MAG: hypothetical protein HQM02_13300 [Magnetococcales bacterium]|nr:hypothetical protein [Magnetococcales bacterium]MBF0308517.1 hypothetical protein [Magnetococcales bacterium]
MRVTQSLMFRNGADALQRKYQEVLKTQEKTLSGNRVNKPSDDPTATFRQGVFTSNLAEVKSLTETTRRAQERMGMAEDQITNLHDRLQEAHDLVMQLGNSYQGGQPDVLRAQAEKAMAWFQDTLAGMNTEMDGVPLFGGGRTGNPFDLTNLRTTGIVQRTGPTGGFADAGADFSAGVTGSDAAVPSSVMVTYRTTDDTGAALAAPEFRLSVNGASLTSVAATGGAQTLNLGNGISFSVAAGAVMTDKQAFHFQVVPEYQGGSSDREVKIATGQKVPGNVTGAQLMEGSTDLSNGANVFEVFAGLRGALQRMDPDEVRAWLPKLQSALGQVSNMQGVTGTRGAQLEAMGATFAQEQESLQEAATANVGIDSFEVMSRLEQATQAMQFMSVTQREVLNTSLLDFIK